MPKDIQEKMVHSLEGLENARIVKYAYAIEYDAIMPTQLNRSLETKKIKNLFKTWNLNFLKKNVHKNIIKRLFIYMEV